MKSSSSSRAGISGSGNTETFSTNGRSMDSRALAWLGTAWQCLRYELEPGQRCAACGKNARWRLCRRCTRGTARRKEERKQKIRVEGDGKLGIGIRENRDPSKSTASKRDA